MNLLRTRTRAVLAITLLALLVAALPLSAQTQTGTLTGTVSQEGAGLPGVRISVSSPKLQGVRTTETDVNGNYNLGALPPGQYTVSFEMEGMQTVTRTVNVTLAGTARADADMKLSSVAEAITVTASAPAVVETSEIQTNLDHTTIENLPTSRTLIGTVNLAPGVNSNGPGGATTISGAPSFDSTYYINGTPVNEVLRGQPLSVFIEDAIQETTVLTGAISAEYGRFTGGVVNAISYSGGNEFMGSLRDSLTNPSWSESSPLGENLLDKTSNQYEATLGGRIIRDRLWFFGAGRYIKSDTQNFFAQSTNSFDTANEQKRYELKLTGQITPKHSIVASGLKLDADITNRCLGGTCWEAQSLSLPESQPQDLYSVNYNGIFTNNLLVDVHWSKSSLTFSGSGGPQGPPETATPLYFASLNQWAGSSLFCGNCTDEIRKSETYGIKPTYYLSTSSMGTHNFVGGYEHFSNSIFSNNHQAGSDFILYDYNDQVRGADGSFKPTLSRNNGFFVYWPILEAAQPNDLATESLFVNDKWDLNNRLSFNLGARYDKNNGKDSAGAKVADDSRVSPRLGLTFDTFGNGRLRWNLSYSEYVSQIANGDIADAGSPAGAPSQLYWLYGGPTISANSSAELLQKAFDWFNSIGGINDRSFLLGGGTNGVNKQIIGSLKAPSVREVAFGVGSQIGRNGYARIDYQDRKWGDFYVNETNLSTGTVLDPLVGAEVDRGLITNSDDLERKYNAILVQAGYRITPRLNLAGNYTWSKLRGNSVPETSGSGPVPEGGPQYYPEVFNFPNSNPVGYLSADQRHKARAWVSYDLPTFLGNFNFSVLERYDSGTPFSEVQLIDPIAGGVTNPGYLNVEGASTSGVNYYFSKRGEFRWDNLTSTDLGINYALPISKVNLFFQGEVINVFNEDAQISGNTTIRTFVTSAGFAPFNPFTDTPIECPQGAPASQCAAMGANFQKSTLFGTATTPGSYQTPRTYRASVGIKF